MTARRRPRWARAAALVLAAASLPACTQVHVTIETTVASDGAVTRSVTFLSEGGPSLKEAYRLPEGRAWTVAEGRVSKEALTPEQRRALDAGPTDTFQRYTARRTYPPGEALSADYVKPHPEAPARVASNAVTVERSPGFLGLGTTFRYRETFTDASKPEAAEKLLREASRLEVARRVGALRAAHPEAAPWEAVEAGELEEMEARLDRMFAAWRSVADEESRRAAERAFDSYTDWAEGLPGRLAAVAGLELEEVEKLLEGPEQERRNEEVFEALSRSLGAHFGIFEGPFTFTLIVHMPGAIFRSNAELQGRSTAICRFSAEYFRMRPFTCEATSWSPEGF